MSIHKSSSIKIDESCIGKYVFTNSIMQYPSFGGGHKIVEIFRTSVKIVPVVYRRINEDYIIVEDEEELRLVELDDQMPNRIAFRSIALIADTKEDAIRIKRFNHQQMMDYFEFMRKQKQAFDMIGE